MCAFHYTIQSSLHRTLHQHYISRKILANFDYLHCLLYYHLVHRHPEPASRPSPQTLLTVLMDHEDAVLRIPAADAATGDLAAVLGAPLSAGQKMYTDLQEQYRHNT